MARITDEANEFMGVLVEYVCYAYQVDYNGLADMLGIDRGWFTRYRNAEFSNKGAGTTFKLIELAANVSQKQLIGVLFEE